MTEKQLVQGCLREKKDYRKELYLRYVNTMMGVSLRYARSNHDAEDILQEAFIRVFNNMHQFSFKGSLEGWIRRIVVHVALRYYDKSSFTKEISGLNNYEKRTISAYPNAYDTLKASDLLRLVDNLPEGYRIVFNMHAIEGFSHKEIANLLEITESTSRSQLTKARKMLQMAIMKMQKVRV